jgi:hypothetical protein
MVKGSSFVAREIVETKPSERIGQQAVPFDRVVTDFAQPKRAVINAGERRIDLVKEEGEAWLSRRRRLEGSLKAPMAPFQLGTKVCLFRSCHWHSCSSVLWIPKMFHPFFYLKNHLMISSRCELHGVLRPRCWKRGVPAVRTGIDFSCVVRPVSSEP